MQVVRLVLAAACLLGLGGCMTASTTSDPWLDGSLPADSSALASEPVASTVAEDAILDPPPVTPGLLGKDPNDDLSIGKKYFRQGSNGLAERHFRKAVETHPRDAESWIGLAASYDRLHKFDLADRAYDSVIKIIGPTPEVLNNRGVSYMLRGDYRRARDALSGAQAKNPNSPYIANNLKLLAVSEAKRKAVE